jgi:choline dehydrogenase
VTSEYQVIVVGAGSSGSALAARLTEDPDREVLVIDRGPTYDRVEDMPPELLEPSVMGAVHEGHAHQYAFESRLIDGLAYPVPRGSGLGGSSALNAAYFVRGTRDDFDHWASLGLGGWSFEEVLPFYKRSETDRDFVADYHGDSGPVAVERAPNQRAHPVTDAFVRACLELGYPEAPDHNAPGADGVGPVPMNIKDGVRQSAGIAYLLPNLARPNLTLRGGTLVRRIVFEGKRAIGVEVEKDGEVEILRAEEIVISAGAVKTPHLLMLSGVGPAEQIEAQGLALVEDIPGVGANLTDHPDVMVSFRPDGEFHPEPGKAAVHAGLTLTAPGSEYPSDIEIVPFLAPIGEVMPAPGMPVGVDLAFAVGLQQEASRGSLRLVSSDPTVGPQVDYNYLSEEQDRVRLRQATRVAVEILRSSAFDTVRKEITEPGLDDLASDRSLDAWVRSHLATAIHMCSTCRMGPDSDDDAVVDGECRVRGLEGLRLVDTSIMPRITSRGPSATATMIGERASAFFTS